MILVFSSTKTKFLLEYVANQKDCRAETFNDEDAKITEVNRVISSMGCDKRDEVNKDIFKYIQSNDFEPIEPVEHPEKDGVALYKVSGCRLEQRIMKNGFVELTPRANLSAIVVVNRVDNKNKIIPDIYDILEYEHGHLVSLIAGGSGESLIEDIGAKARSAGITILGRDHLSKSEVKSLEKQAGQHIQEAFEESKKEEKIDLLDQVKNSGKKRK